MEQRIVVHTKGGTLYKGVTQDFAPECESFHFLPAEGGGVPMLMQVDDLKALFWVRSYLGNRKFVARRAFDAPAERRAVVRFQDGEEIWGTLVDEGEAPRGFFLLPADKDDNNVRIFVVRSAIQELRLV